MVLVNAVWYGLILSLLLTLVIAISFFVAPDMWVGDYPEDIQEKYGEMSSKAKRYRTPVALAFFLVALLVPLLGIVHLRQSTDFVLGFIDHYNSAFISLFVFNLFDWLVLDWLLFVTIQPTIVVLPGTEGMAGYKDYWFHFKAFLSGIGFCLGGALLIAGLAWLIL